MARKVCGIKLIIKCFAALPLFLVRPPLSLFLRAFVCLFVVAAAARSVRLASTFAACDLIWPQQPAKQQQQQPHLCACQSGALCAAATTRHTSLLLFSQYFPFRRPDEHCKCKLNILAPTWICRGGWGAAESDAAAAALAED